MSTPLPSVEPAHWTVVVADHDLAAGRRTRSLLEGAGFRVLPPVSTAKDAAGLVVISRPDALVMDMQLSNDIEAYRAVAAVALEKRIPVVYTSSSADREMLERAADGHAAAYIVKPFADRQLVSAVLLAVLSAARGTAPVMPRRLTNAEKLRAIASVLEDAALHESLDDRPSSATRQSPSALVKGLTPREQEIVDLLANGARVASVAARLGLSAYTVRNHLKSIFRKLNVRGQHELFEYWGQLQERESRERDV